MLVGVAMKLEMIVVGRNVFPESCERLGQIQTLLRGFIRVGRTACSSFCLVSHLTCSSELRGVG